MKAKTKLTKLWSILLSLVMLLSLLPTTALAAGTYPDAGAVIVDGGTYFATGYHYFRNGETTSSNNPNNYNAYYNPTTGTLTLQDYNGGSIIAGGTTTADITIKLVGNNTVTGSVISDMGGDITITSDSSGTLTITNTLNDSNAAIGIQAGYGPQTTGNVTITGSADVKIEVTHNGTNGHEDAYGIFAKENITISENASVDITCATPHNTYSNIYCNGLRADENVTVNTDGTIKINVTTAGDSGTQSFGIYPMGTATLTKVGNMEVQWKKHKTNTSYPGGAVYKGTSFDANTHAINAVDMDETKCYASYRHGTPYEVTVVNGDLTGPGVPNKMGSGMFLVNDTVNITPYERKSNSGEVIPFKEWTAEGMTLTSPSTKDTSFNVPTNDVTVTATYNPFDGAPVFTRTDDSSGTIAFQTAVKPDGGAEYFEYVKVGKENDPYGYRSIAPQPTTASTASSYEYSVSASNYYTGGDIKNLEAGDYRMAVTLSGKRYLSDPFTVDYTAAPTVTYPNSVTVYNANKGIIGLSDGECLTANDATGASSYTDGTSYVARYDKSSGTLYLKGYQGVGAEGGIVAAGDLNIKVERDSSFTTSRTSTDDLMGIQASGKLNISGNGKLTVTATGRGDVYGIYAKEGVTISAPLAVTVGKNNETENGPVYGIYTKSGAISLSGNDMIVTATGGTSNVYGVYNAADTSTTITNNGYIDISGKLTVNLNKGNSNIGIYTGSGGTITLDGATVIIPGNFNPGIFNNNGNVIIKNNSNVTLTSDVPGSWGVYAKYGGDLIIENSTVKVSADSLAACLERGNVSIKDSKVELTSKYKHYEVIRTGNSSAANTIDLSGNGSVTLTASGEQTNYAMITGKVTLGPNTKCEMGTPDGNSYDGVYDGSSKTVLQFVHEDPAPAANISLDKTGTVDFGSKEAGYTAAPAAQTVTITNNGTAATGELTIALEGTNATSFELSKDKISDITASGTDTFTVQPKTGLLAGIYNATVKVSGTGVTEKSFDVKFTVTAPATPITDTLVPVSDLTGKTYNESAQEPTFGGSLARGTDYTVSYAVKSSSTGALNSDGKPVGAGTYVVTVTGKGSYTGSFTKDFKIDKADPVYTAPTAKTGLAYTGSALELITAGSVSKGGEMQYKLAGGSYGPDIPVATNAGNYTVYYQIAANDNYNAVAETQVGSGAINIAPADQSAPTGLGVAAPTTSSGKGKITGTTTAMEYNTDATATSGWMACSATETEVAPGTYYVRLKADANHNAGTVSAALVVPAYSATKYTVTVTYDANGTASADKTANVAAGETVTLTATPNSGYVFDKWDDKTPTSLTIGTDGKFTMPSDNVSVKATFKGAALTGTASITGTLKFGEELTASLTGTNNTGTLTYKWYRGSDEIIGATGSTYTLVEDDIGKTITVAITSNVQTGEITGSTTGTIEKADGPEAPTAFTLSFTPNADGTTFTATIPTVVGGEYSFDGTNYSATNTKADCAANSSYTGYVRIAETPTQKASAVTSDTKTSPKLTVATPTFTPNGASGFTGTQSVTISCTTAGAKIHYTTDGTDPTASSPVYSAALSLTSTTTVKAIAVKAGMNDSAIATATFTKYSGGGGGGGGSYTPSYTVSVDKTENGTITVSPKSASKGDTVTITVKPDKGYELEDLTVLDSKGKELALTEKNGKYSFKMPSGKVTVKGSFVEEAPVQIFKDVPVDAYYYEAVKWAAEKGITGGVGNGLFAPNQPCTRAQIVTFLWRAAGSPAPRNMSSFADVPADAFYAKAVAWAVENGITGGTGDGKFSPDATCTRAQSVTFLYRAAGSPKVSGSAEFGDVATNAYYADAVAWAAKNGITGGIGGGLFGSGNDCTRAQIVTFLYRYFVK